MLPDKRLVLFANLAVGQLMFPTRVMTATIYSQIRSRSRNRATFAIHDQLLVFPKI